MLCYRFNPTTNAWIIILLLNCYIGLVISAVANNLLAVLFLSALLTGTPTFFSGKVAQLHFLELLTSACSHGHPNAMVNCLYMLFTLGVLWPLEGLPRGIHWISNFMPVTYAVLAVKAVVSKGDYFTCLYILWHLFCVL